MKIEFLKTFSNGFPYSHRIFLVLTVDYLSSRMEELHLQTLTELYRILSHHTALIFQPLVAPIANAQSGKFWIFTHALPLGNGRLLQTQKFVRPPR